MWKIIGAESPQCTGAESSAWARVRETLVARAGLAWVSYSSLGEIDRSRHCLSCNSHISTPKQQSKIVHTFITDIQFMQYPTNTKTNQKIVQDSKNSNFPVPGKSLVEILTARPRAQQL